MIIIGACEVIDCWRTGVLDLCFAVDAWICGISNGCVLEVSPCILLSQNLLWIEQGCCWVSVHSLHMAFWCLNWRTIACRWNLNWGLSIAGCTVVSNPSVNLPCFHSCRGAEIINNWQILGMCTRLFGFCTHSLSVNSDISIPLVIQGSWRTVGSGLISSFHAPLPHKVSRPNSVTDPYFWVVCGYVLIYSKNRLHKDMSFANCLVLNMCLIFQDKWTIWKKGTC